MENLIGRYAVSLAGHDEETVYLVVGHKENYLLLCDGKYKTLEKPKKKSRKHVQVMNISAGEPLCSKLLKNEKVFDHEIKYAIKQYLSK